MAFIQKEIKVEKFFNALGVVGVLLLVSATSFNLYVLSLVAKTPDVVLWPKILGGGDGDRLVDVLFTLSSVEISAWILALFIRDNPFLFGLNRKWIVWGSSAVTVLMLLCNYYACYKIASAC